MHNVVKPEKLNKLFPEAELQLRSEETKGKELLISHRKGRLAPRRESFVGDLVFWDSPSGKTTSRAHPELVEGVKMEAYESNPHFAHSMKTAAIKYDEIIEDPKGAKALLMHSSHLLLTMIFLTGGNGRVLKLLVNQNVEDVGVELAT